MRSALPILDRFLGLALGLEALDLGVEMDCGFVVGWARRMVVLGVVGSRRVSVVVGRRVELGTQRHWCNWCEEQRSL